MKEKNDKQVVLLPKKVVLEMIPDLVQEYEKMIKEGKKKSSFEDFLRFLLRKNASNGICTFLKFWETDRYSREQKMSMRALITAYVIIKSKYNGIWGKGYIFHPPHAIHLKEEAQEALKKRLDFLRHDFKNDIIRCNVEDFEVSKLLSLTKQDQEYAYTVSKNYFS